jgi:PST family polysaccharide transporter
MSLWVVPHIFWCCRGTPLSPFDLFAVIWKPFLASLAAAATALATVSYLSPSLAPVLRLLVGGSLMGGVYVAVLLFAMGQKEFYVELFRLLMRGSSGPPAKLVITPVSVGSSVSECVPRP